MCSATPHLAHWRDTFLPHWPHLSASACLRLCGPTPTYRTTPQLSPACSVECCCHCSCGFVGLSEWNVSEYKCCQLCGVNFSKSGFFCSTGCAPPINYPLTACSWLTLYYYLASCPCWINAELDPEAVQCESSTQRWQHCSHATAPVYDLRWLLLDSVVGPSFLLEQYFWVLQWCLLTCIFPCAPNQSANTQQLVKKRQQCE